MSSEIVALAWACTSRPSWRVRASPIVKTDVNDSMGLVDLLAHGLMRASFVPQVAVQELRILTRTRTQFVREGSAHA